MESISSGSVPSPSVDWTAPNCPVTEHFSVKDCLYFPRWGRLAITADGLTSEILAACQALASNLETVRAWYGCPLLVHCWFRNVPYNLLVGGARGSAHLEGLAVDFSPATGSCRDFIQRVLAEQCLAEWGMRMENNGPYPSWVHLDLRAPGASGTYFVP
jgi:zinc D-Ala-D-Ala carboxypeptidase